MTTNSAFWRDLEAQFRALPDPKCDLAAIKCDNGHWEFLGDSDNHTYQARLDSQFRSLARRAAIEAGVPSRTNALDWWLSLLAEDQNSSIIRNVVLKSAEQCIEFATRAFELEHAARSGAPLGLRRDRYPLVSWLYNHDHNPLPDSKEELEYWRSHIWQGYGGLIGDYKRIVEKDQRMGRPIWEHRQKKLDDAIVGLSYDLAVLQANHIFDRSLRGAEAIRGFDDEVAPLLAEVESALRASRENLALPCENGSESARDLAAKPFRRVRDDVQRLLCLLSPVNPRPAEEPRAKFDGADLANDPTKPVAAVEPTKVANIGNSPDPSVASWQAIEIFFLSDERVQICNGQQTETRNYEEWGFADSRNGKPNQAWVTLRAIAKEDGIIRNAAKTGGDWKRVEKRIQEIRKVLKQHFRLSTDPLPFIAGTGYQARFKIGCLPSFRS